MQPRSWTHRAAAASAALAAVLALGAAPAQADPSTDPATDATVVRTPQTARVLADGDTGGKRPV
ncbi:hypothetical protein FAF44_31475 [Nonomuraea sp. MG754425]|uniref:hypothetical protein n=1 Tax=Nonomuraea sp. MG754425 TaxID=2570319 RepID=UPI001F2FC6A2|nr:hypothetical protein [Nonomuraea sp. MG754425]MCF6472882.1 hypothetical protein [Nonomuraea sp. MG754425]